MAASEKQFQTLLAQLIARVDKMLAANEPIVPLGLALRTSGTADISIGVPGNTPSIPGMTIALRQSLIKTVSNGGVIATCIAFPHDASPSVIALLENNENDCATVRIPILPGTPRTLDKNGMQIDEGYIYIFPVLDEE